LILLIFYILIFLAHHRQAQPVATAVQPWGKK